MRRTLLKFTILLLYILTFFILFVAFFPQAVSQPRSAGERGYYIVFKHI